MNDVVSGAAGLLALRSIRRLRAELVPLLAVALPPAPRSTLRSGLPERRMR
jgi:hypothetical protein